MQRARPVVRTRSQVRLVRPRRRWQSVTWWYSLLIVVPVLLIAADALFGIGPERPSRDLSFRLTDGTTGAVVSGASVAVGETVLETDADGKVSLRRPKSSTAVQIQANGYQPLYGRFDGDSAAEQRIALRPLTVAATTAQQQQAIGGTGGAQQGEAQAGQTAPTSTVAPETTAAVGGAQAADGESAATGVVRDANGNAIRGAVVWSGERSTKSKKDGSFQLKGIAAGEDLTVFAPGYADVTMAAGADLQVSLQRFDVKGIYVSGLRAGDPEFIDEIIKLIDQTELNAVVLDIKEHDVFYDTQVEFFRAAGVVRPTYDPAVVVKQFRDRGIYVIARQVVFKDPLVAEAYPDLAVKSDGGGLWRGWQDDAWVNPFNEELWQPNIDLAVEAANLGFDEIQYDYIRFPSDGDLTTADFGPNYDEEGRVGAIVEFLKRSQAAIRPTGAKLAVDVFGIVAVYGDDQGIGQRLTDVAKVVDYVCPMVYPSHFDAGSIDVGGEPNDLPYETIELSMALAADKMPGMTLKLRPWLQDFSLRGMKAYGPEEVQAQIAASDAQGASGWLLWNPGNEYDPETFKPE